MNTIFFHGPLAVTLDCNGRVLSVADRITGQIPPTIFSQAFIDSAVRKAVLAFESVCDEA